MSKVVTTTVLPEVDGTSLTIGASGDNVVVTGNDLRANVIQDAGGNAIFTSDGSGVLSGMNSGMSGAMNLISTTTASNQASVTITGFSSTYDVYIIKIIELTAATNIGYFRWQGSTDGTNFNISCTTTACRAYHKEDDSQTGFGYLIGSDAANVQTDVELCASLANDSDASAYGEIHYFNPLGTTYMKHWYTRFSTMDHDDVSCDEIRSGYWNTTSAVTHVKFVMASGNLDGVFKLYGISKS
jgi:hypothetical protein